MSLSIILDALVQIGAVACTVILIEDSWFLAFASIIWASARIGHALALAGSFIESMIRTSALSFTVGLPSCDITEAVTEWLFSWIRCSRHSLASCQFGITFAIASIFIEEMPIRAVLVNAHTFTTTVALLDLWVLALCIIWAFACAKFFVELLLVAFGGAIPDALAITRGQVLLESFSTIDFSALACAVTLVILVLVRPARRVGCWASADTEFLVKLSLGGFAFLDALAVAIIEVLSEIRSELLLAFARDALALASGLVSPLSGWARS